MRFLHGANYLKTIVIPEGVTVLQGNNYYNADDQSSGAFYQCVKLSSVTIPSTVTEIGPYVFFNCTSLNDINYTNTIETWNSINKGVKWNKNVPVTSVTCTNGTV